MNHELPNDIDVLTILLNGGLMFAGSNATNDTPEAGQHWRFIQDRMRVLVREMKDAIRQNRRQA